MNYDILMEEEIKKIEKILKNRLGDIGYER